MSWDDYQRHYATTSRERQREYDDERDAEIAAASECFALDLGEDGVIHYVSAGEVPPHLDLAVESVAMPRFRTDEMEPGESASLAEMLAANPTDPDGFDNDDLHAWLRSARVGDQFRDIVTVERVA